MTLTLVGDRFSDCVVTPVPERDAEHAVAIVSTRRGTYTLVRNHHTPEMCFPVKTGKVFGTTKLKGYHWFRVVGDEIRPVR